MDEQKKTTEYASQSAADKRQQKRSEALAHFQDREVPEVKKKKNKWLMPVILIVAIGIGVFFIIQMSASLGEEQKSFSEVFGSVKLENALLAVGVLFAIIFFDIAKYIITLHATTGKFRPLVGAKTSLLGRYYDNITPFAAGGQPAQIFYLHTKGLSGGLSSAVVLIKYFFNTWAWVLVALASMIYNAGAVLSVNNGLVILIVGWIGWAINMSLPLFILFFVMMPKFATKLTKGVIRIGRKLHIVKDEEKALNKALRTVKDFRASFSIMAKRPVQLVLLCISCIAETSLTFAFPYFIIKMFNGFSGAESSFATMFTVMALNAYSFFGASIVPTPGSSGVIELIITLAFSSIAGSTLMWVIFTWRFAVFYIYIIIGLFISIFSYIRSLVFARKAKNSPVVAAADVSAEAPLPNPTPQAQRIVEIDLDEAPKTTDSDASKTE